MAKGLGIGRTLTVGVIAVVVGIAIGIGGLFAIQNAGGNSNTTISASVVFERMAAQNEMVTVDQSYSVFEEVKDTQKLFEWDIPFTTSTMWYLYAGTLKAGVNLGSAEFVDGGNTLTVTLDAPYIISNTPDMDKSGVQGANESIFNKFPVSAADEAQREAIRLSEEQAIEGGLLDEAKTNAEKNITEMFEVALGDGYTVKFNWREAEAAPQPAEEGASVE